MLSTFLFLLSFDFYEVMVLKNAMELWMHYKWGGGTNYRRTYKNYIPIYAWLKEKKASNFFENFSRSF